MNESIADDVMNAVEKARKPISQDVAYELLEFAKRITAWLSRASKQALEQARVNKGRFDILADACERDSKNYLAMMKDGDNAIARAEGK